MSEYPKNISINKEKNSRFWCVSFIAQDGRQRRRSTKVPVEGGVYGKEVLTPKQAKTRALIIGSEIAKKACDAVEQRNNISVKDFLEEYLQRKKDFVTTATYINMKGAYSRLCDYLGKRANMPMANFKRDEAKKFVEFRRQEVRASSVKKDITSISPAFNDALDSEIIARNPFIRLSIEPDKADEKVFHDAFSLDEIKFMIKHFPDEWPSVIRCCFETYGQRLGDIIHLKWEQFDFENRVVNITTGKTGRVLAQPMRLGFYEWALTRRNEEKPRSNDYLHPNLAEIGANRASIEFGQLIRAFKIGSLSSPASGKRRRVNSKTFHSIRATCATLIHATGVSEGTAMKLVGHDSDAIHRGYLRPDIEQMRNAAERIPSLED